MKFCKWFGVLFFFGLGCSLAADAQIGIYATATGNWFGGVTCQSFAAPCAESGGKVKPFGGNFGAFYDFRSFGPIRLGVDARGTVESSNKRADAAAGGPGIVKNYEGLAGLRATFRTPIHWLHPYAEIAGGYARNNASGLYTNTITINNNLKPPTSQTVLSYNPAAYTGYGLVKGFVGLDIPLLPYLSLRAIELGEGEAFGSAPILETTTVTTSGTSTTSSTVVNLRSGNSHGVQSVGAGIVINLPFLK
jgi:hypothetical protein